ncbi:MAG: DNA recombination protein RmuC [Arenicellales bacterium WSBS_2016_MAG_OTU3]
MLKHRLTHTSTQAKPKTTKQRAQFLSQHASQVRARIKELASKAYWQYFKHAPDFVVLFLPGEQFLHATLERDHTIGICTGQQSRVGNTHASLIAILKTVEYSWRRQTLAENTEQIKHFEACFARFTIFSEHLAKLGKSMDAGFTGFNRVVGSFESKLLPASRRFASLGVNSAKETPEKCKR